MSVETVSNASRSGLKLIYNPRYLRANKMAKLYFYYSAMNAGKSTTLLQSDYNYWSVRNTALCAKLR